MKLTKDHLAKDSELTIRTSVTSAEGWAEADRIQWEVRNQGSDIFEGVIRIEERLSSECRHPWIMVPGFIYGENRRLHAGVRDESYPRVDPHADKPSLMTSSYWDFAADRVSHPVVFAYEHGRCFALCSRPHVVLSEGCSSDEWEPQIAIGFGYIGDGAYSRITFPACEEPFTYSNSTQSSATIRRVRIPPQGTISGELFLIRFDGRRHDYQKVLEFCYDKIGIDHRPAQGDEPLALMRDAVHGIVNHHYNESRNYFVYGRCYDRVSEQIANRHGTTLEWHQMNTGFVSGFPVCWGLNVAAWHLNDPRARTISRLVADRICKEGISPSGLFWADFRPGTIQERNRCLRNPLAPDGEDVWGSGWWKESNCVHARTIADANYSLANLIISEARHDPCSASLGIWKNALLGNVRAILVLQLPGGSYGGVYDAVNGKVRRAEGCGGLLWIPALLRSCEVFAGDERSLVSQMEESVHRAAAAYATAVEDEYIWGAPEDNDSPTSEDGLNAVLAYGELYRRFKEPRYLELMRIAADWTLSFRKCFNGKFHPKSLVGAYDLRSKGGDYASAANNHLHVMEVMITSHLFDLARWTGKDYYRRRAQDHWHFTQQMLCRVDGQFNGFRGGLAEQFYWCNWSCFGQDTRALEPDGFTGNWDPGPHHRQKGNMAGYSTIWCINMILLGADMMLRERTARREGATPEGRS